MESIKVCPSCGTPYFEGNKMCKCPPRLEMQASKLGDEAKSFARDRRHNYRTDNLPSQGTDKHIDEVK